MTAHLTELEQLAAADGALAADRLAHVASCAACRAAVEDAEMFLGRVAAADVPEPSPLFWDHFAARVRQATHQAAPAPRFVSSWRGWISLAATAATLVLAVWVVRQPQSTAVVPRSDETPGVAISARTEPAAGSEAVSWETVVATTAALDDEALFDFGEADASLDDLTQAERVAFVRLLSEEMDVLQ